MIRHLPLTLLLALLAPAICSGQEWAKKMFATTSHDFGAVARGATVEYSFKFNNPFEEDVHIASVSSSCGCTTPRVTKDLLKTYDESAVIAVFNTKSFLGQRSATLTVRIDQPFPAEVQLSIAGYIRSDIVLTPGAAEFGTVDQGTGAEKKLTITYAGRNDWKILSTRSSSPHVQSKFTETARGNGQVSYELLVSIRPDAPAGYLKDQVMLVTDDQQKMEVPVEVEARIVSELTISPTNLFLGALAPGQKVTKQLVVQAKRPFRVTKVECSDPSFAFQAADGTVPKPVHLVPVTFTAGADPGKITRQIVITTDLGPQSVSAFAQVVEPSKAE